MTEDIRDHDGTTEFAFGGRLALDLTWTLRYRAIAPTELLTDGDALVRWLCAARFAASITTATTEAPDDAIQLREAIYRTAAAHIDGRPDLLDDVTTINRYAAHHPTAPQLRHDGSIERRVADGSAVEAALSDIARDAIQLFGNDDTTRLRRCEGTHCSLLFYDTSRPGTRRWCSTARCGNRVNTRSYRARKRRT